jgi:hypothetical protein
MKASMWYRIASVLLLLLAVGRCDIGVAARQLSASDLGAHAHHYLGVRSVLCRNHCCKWKYLLVLPIVTGAGMASLESEVAEVPKPGTDQRSRHHVTQEVHAEQDPRRGDAEGAEQQSDAERWIKQR